MKNMPYAFRVALLLICSSSYAVAQEAAAERELEQSIRPKINENFLDADLDVEQWLQRFEGESREVFVGRDEVLQACDIAPGASVADIGAGTGLYTMLFAKAVGSEGWVFGVDIAPRFLEHLNERAGNTGVENLTAVLGSQRSVNLAPESIDLAFICDTYHHFEYPKSTMDSIPRALKDGGRLIVIDFERIPGESRDWIFGHVRAGKEVFRAEIQDAGFILEEEKKVDGLKENYFLMFRKG